jgi:hypothetical protein
MYFSGPWENMLALWHYFKIILFQITNKTNLPKQCNIPFPNPAGGHQRPPSALTLLVFEVIKCDAR